MAKPLNNIDLPAAPTAQVGKLIAELCPEGVEVKSIGEICQINRGRVMSKDYLRNYAGEYPVYSSQTVDDGVFGRINTYDYDGEYLTWTTDGANAGSIFYRNGKFSITNVCGLLKVKGDGVNTKFLLYILATVSKQYVSAGMGNPKIMSNVMEKIKIPIPPLAIQQEIVKILDTFTTLEAELEAELEARKKQYEYYRDELLTFGEDVEWKTLGEVCLKTENIKWKESNNINYQYIDLSSVSRENNKISETQTINSTNAPSRAQQIIKIDDVIFGTTRPTLKRYALINSEYNNQICSTGFCVLRANKKLLLPSFLFFILKTMKFYYFVENNQEGAGYPSISNSKVKEFPIPIPPLAEQQRIVAILDKFDALVNDISVGLPAELYARRKQYEYYRNKLLTFEPLEKEYAS
ncbi:MAG: restriction endonuclease subunit S [Syntrophus sp. (in: bacteria)]|nr:restriction endonuclease subunit S [Syntrophus sp. (in: bacteria)]MBA4418407.1 restriction endonuclease subunit S [Syntrophus sp. (in: bacteria)]